MVAIQKFEFEDTDFEGVKIIHPFMSFDDRGFFMKTYERNVFEQNGVFISNAEDMMSCSNYGVIRGLHFQTYNSQPKVIRVASGKAYYVAVDLREGSSTFGEWRGYYLSDENHVGMYIPSGFAHGLLSLSDKMIFTYRCGTLYEPDYDSGIRWDDKDLNIFWPIERENVIVSEKDKSMQNYREFCEKIGSLKN